MTPHPLRTERSGPQTASAVTDLPFKPQLVTLVFRGVTSLHVSRPAARAAASVTRTVLTEIIDGARSAAAEEARTKLIPKDLVSAIDRNVEVEVGSAWYLHSPTFHGLVGEVRNADGALVSLRERRGARTPIGVACAHRFEAGVKRLLRSRGVRAVPAMVRDLDGIASVFLTDLARDAAEVVREGGVKRFGSAVGPVVPGEPFPAPLLKDPSLALSARRGDGRTVGGHDVLAAVTMQLFGDLRERAITEAAEMTTRTTSAD
jgi:histone H3/H4